MKKIKKIWSWVKENPWKATAIGVGALAIIGTGTYFGVKTHMAGKQKLTSSDPVTIVNSSAQNMKTIKQVKRCQPAGRYMQGTCFSKGDFVPDENQGRFIVKFIEGGIRSATRPLLLPLIGKNKNQHITPKDLNGLKGMKVDPRIFKE